MGAQRRIDSIFCKQKELVFISHLDVIRLFTRTLRRARLPLVYTQGFHPPPKLSWKRALPLGVASEHEEMSMYVTEPIDLDTARERLNALMPGGIQIKEMSYGKENENQSKN